MNSEDKKRSHGKTSRSQPPSPWVRRFAGLVPEGGAVLDLACGAGRHARMFLELGHPVLCIDQDTGGVADLEGRDGVQVMRADLEGEDGNWPLAGRRFAGIVVVNYLHRPLFPHLFRSLETGGVLIYQTFALGNEKLGRPRNPHFLLRRGELLERVEGELQVVAFEEGMVDGKAPMVMQRICAVNEPPGHAHPPHPLM